jgi:outer membrane lipase/esterase
MRVLKSLLAPALLATVLATLSGCGGSSSRVEAYVPTRMVVFGDEISLINPNGSKHSVNALKADGVTFDCATHPIWPQVVASAYGMVFKECNPGGVTTLAADMQATAKARVADVVRAAAPLQGAFTPETLVTVMAGQHDILDAYAAYDAGTLTRAQAKAQVTAVGKTLGALVNTMANQGSGARVLYATPPNLGYSPYAATEVTRTGSLDRQTLLRELTLDFISGLRLEVINDGRYAALITADELALSLADTTKLAANALTNVVDPACLTTAVLPNCTDTTLVSDAGGVASRYLWADAQYLGVTFHARVGLTALNRARNNPF